MKTKILFFFLLFALANNTRSDAQIRFSINIGLQPIWGPTGYDHVENYYLPDIDAYYNVESRSYTYITNGRWVTTMSLPWQYRNYDLYHGYKVVMNEPKPYLHYNQDRGQHDQQPIRDSRDEKYFENRNHPKHQEWKENDRHDNSDHHDNRNKGNNGRGNGNGKWDHD